MNQSHKLVSVIVTTKNNEKIIERCIRSVIEQRHKRVELIVIDNHSSDRTSQIARKYTPHVFQQGPERSAQRNCGAQKSHGEYLFFIDSDMKLEPTTVEQCVRACQKTGAVIVDEKFIGKGFWSKCKALEKSCHTGTGDGEAARFFARDLFFKANGYDEDLTGPEDIDMHKRVALRVNCFGRAAGIIHYDEYISFSRFVKKRYYYSQSLKRYFQKHPLAKQKEFRFIRGAFLRNWKLLLADPLHCFGFILLRTGEGAAIGYALLKTFLNRKTSAA